MENTKPIVIVLSRNYSTGLGVIRSLGVAGYTVDLVASTKKKGSSVIASCSRYVRNAVEVQSKKIQGDTGESLIDKVIEMAEKENGKSVLFPTDDFTASIVISNRERLSQYFYLPETSADAKWKTIELMDKTCQSRIAEQCGFLTPSEWKISLKDEIDIPDDIMYPCFVKPLQSISGQKKEMKKCSTSAELYDHLKEMKEYFNDRSVLVQEFLNIKGEYDLSGVCMDENVFIPAVIRKTRISEHEKGVTMSGEMLPLDVLGDLKETAVSFLKTLRYHGMIDMELNICDKGIYFNEINFRSGGPSYFYYLCGVNLPEMFVRDITGEENNIHEITEYGKTFVYEKVAWEDYIYKFIDKKQMREAIDSADFTLIVDKNDPKPGKCFKRRIRLSFLKNRIKNRFGRI